MSISYRHNVLRGHIRYVKYIYPWLEGKISNEDIVQYIEQLNVYNTTLGYVQEDKKINNTSDNTGNIYYLNTIKNNEKSSCSFFENFNFINCRKK